MVVDRALRELEQRVDCAVTRLGELTAERRRLADELSSLQEHGTGGNRGAGAAAAELLPGEVVAALRGALAALRGD